MRQLRGRVRQLDLVYGGATSRSTAERFAEREVQLWGLEKNALIEHGIAQLVVLPVQTRHGAQALSRRSTKRLEDL
jgi:hypothetical protein